MFFGSEIAKETAIGILSGVPELTATVGDRIEGATYLPDEVPTPAALVYAEQGAYDSSIGGPISYEGLTLVVRVICEGRSTDPIYDAAIAQGEALNGMRVDVEHRGSRYRVIFTAAAEVANTTLREDGRDYRQLGTLYEIEISKG